MSYEDAIKTVLEGTLASKTDAELREMLKGCMDIHGTNPLAFHRITHAADVIRAELASRGSERRHRQTQRVAWLAALAALAAAILGAAALLRDTGSSTAAPQQASSPKPASP
jgi:hypothetical protein